MTQRETVIEVMLITANAGPCVHVQQMHRDYAPSQKPPFCPACGREMKLARLITKQAREGDLNVFECGSCRVSYTSAAEERGTGGSR